jgi:hypothetical protein
MSVEPMKKTDRGFSLGFWLAFGLIAVLIVLTMVQVDRQWQRMAEMTRILQEQAERHPAHARVGARS